MRDRTTSIVLCIIGLLLILFAISSRKPISIDKLEKIEKQTQTNTAQNTGNRLFSEAKYHDLVKQIVQLQTKIENQEELIGVLKKEIEELQTDKTSIENLAYDLDSIDEQIKELQDQYSTAKTYALEEYNNATNRLYKLEQSVEEFYKDKKYFFSERDRINKSIQDLYGRMDELKNAPPKIQEKEVYVYPCRPKCQ